MQYALTKDRLPKGFSFPLKRSVLDGALRAAGLPNELHHVYYARPQQPGLMLRIDYCGEDRKGWFAAGKSSLWLFAVPSDKRKQAEIALVTHGLPNLTGWLDKIRAAGNSIRGPDQTFELWYRSEAIQIAATIAPRTD